MKKYLMGGIAVLFLGLLGSGAIILFGAVDIAADSPHGPLVYKLIEAARDRAIDRRAAQVVLPADLSANARIGRGAGNYAAMCANCHLTPGITNSEIRKGLYPSPPDLTKTEDTSVPVDLTATAARQFWIIKHGIKATGMAAWGKGGMADEDIWNLVAFLQKLPTLTRSQYQALVDASAGHSHAGMPDGASSEKNKPQQQSNPGKHEHGSHDH